MPRLAYLHSVGRDRMPGRRWSAIDDATLRDAIATEPVSVLAARLNRTPQAIRARASQLHVRRADGERWVSSTEAARRSGYTQQHLTALARHGRVIAHRIPGGRWWLFDAVALPCAVAGHRRRWAT